MDSLELQASTNHSKRIERSWWIINYTFVYKDRTFFPPTKTTLNKFMLNMQIVTGYLDSESNQLIN